MAGARSTHAPSTAGQQQGSTSNGDSAGSPTQHHASAPSACRALGGGFLLLPALRRLRALVQRHWLGALAASAAGQLWRVLVPSGGVQLALCTLSERLQLLALDLPLTAGMLYFLGERARARACVCVCVCV
jgi:hypothetical protein